MAEMYHLTFFFLACGITLSTAWQYVSQKQRQCFRNCETCPRGERLQEIARTFPDECIRCYDEKCTDASTPFFAECLSLVKNECRKLCNFSQELKDDLDTCYQCRAGCVNEALKARVLETSKCLKKCSHYHECPKEPRATCNDLIKRTCDGKALNCYIWARSHFNETCSPIADFEEYKKVIKCKRCYMHKCGNEITSGPGIYFAEHEPLVNY